MRDFRKCWTCGATLTNQEYALHACSSVMASQNMPGHPRARSEEVEARAEGEFPPRLFGRGIPEEWMAEEQPRYPGDVQFISVLEHEALRAQDRAEISLLKQDKESVRREAKIARDAAEGMLNAERETFLAEHDENVRLHTELAAEREARKHDLARIQELRAALEFIANPRECPACSVDDPGTEVPCYCDEWNPVNFAREALANDGGEI